jgi:hypothetical protein
MTDAPVFIGGPDRCGKTLLAAILGSHSEIAIPIVGSNLWTLFAGHFGDLADDANLDRCLAALASYKHARFLDPDLVRVRRDLRASERTYARLFALIHEQFAERAGKPRWGDQTGLVERYADEIFSAYRDARMVHMLRDPRDRYEASLALWAHGRGRAGAAAARWRYSARLARRNAARYPDRYRVVRYEDLVRDPEGTVRGVTTFLGLPFEPSMLDMADAPTYRRKLAGGGDAPTGAPLITADHIGDYRGRIPIGEQAFLEYVLGAEMRHLGYERDPARLTHRDAVSYWGWTLPANAARMLAWNALEAVQHRFPRHLGRKPPRAKVVDPTTAER